MCPPPSQSDHHDGSGERSAAVAGARQDGRFLVAGIGASAGGLDALRRMLSGVSDDPGIAFVVVQHLDPTHHSRLPELLASRARLPVEQVEHEVTIAPNRIYIIPPDRWLRIDDGVLRLEQMPKERSPRMSIDRFLRSLAEDRGRLAAAAILSGTGTDGTEGLKAIKEHGGLAIVQDPDTCDHPGMPQSAIASGLIDAVLPPEEMITKIEEFARHPYIAEPATEPTDGSSDDGVVSEILDVVRSRKKFKFDCYKRQTIWRRIMRRMGLLRVREPERYLDRLREDDEEVDALAQDLLIGVTEFFRDKEAFRVLEDEVVPAIFRGKVNGDVVRVWVPGCATGEEAYSIGMLLLEHVDRERHGDIKIQVFASDVDENALQTARNGRYPRNIAESMSDERLERFFDSNNADEGYFQIGRVLRETVIFASHDLLSDAPFSKMDLISCRNLLIYLNADVQRRLIELFHFALQPGGFLFIGSSESIGSRQELFKTISKTWRIYRRTGTQRGHLTFPIVQPKRDAKPGSTPHRDSRDETDDIGRLVCNMILEEHGPAAVAVNQALHAVYLQGPIDDYLRLPVGEATHDLQRMLRDGLTTRVRTVVQRAMRENRRFAAEAQMADSDGSKVAVQIAGQPIESHQHGELVLLTFQKREAKQAGDAVDDVLDPEQSVLHQLEHELEATREDLQTTIEELETSNEELRSSNEELQSSNEELESSTEELQSLNEELTTINNQLEAKIDELETANNDIRNFLTSTGIATLFIDAQMRVKRFTPQARKLLGLIDADEGRPLRRFASPLIDEQLLDDAKGVLDELTPAERRIRTDDAWYVARVLPYRTGDDRIEGVVITFTDVTPLERARSELEHRVRQQETIVRLGTQAVTNPNPNDLMEHAVREVRDALDADFAKVLELERDGASFRIRAGVGWDDQALRHSTVSAGPDSQAGYTLTTREPVIVTDLREERRFSAAPLLSEHDVVSGMSCIIGDPTLPYGVLGVHAKTQHDYSAEDGRFLQTVANLLSNAVERARAGQRVAESEERLRLATESGEMAIWDWNLQTDESVWDDRLFSLLGLDPRSAEAKGETFLERVHAQDRDRLDDLLREAIEEDGVYDTVFRVVEPSGQVRWLAARGRVIRSDGGKPIKMLGVNYDVTAQQQASRFGAAQQAIAREISVIRDLSQACEQLLEIFHREMNIEVCEIWRGSDKGLTCTAQRLVPELDAELWRRATDAARIEEASAVPGRVYRTGEPEWIDDVRRDHGFVRRDAAEELELCTAFAFPVMVGGGVSGVIVCITRECHLARPALLQTLVTIGRDIGSLVERARAAWHREMLINELNHRVKNTLAVVQSIASQTMRYSRSPERFKEAFDNRLQALGRAHLLLTQREWIGTDFKSLIDTVLSPFSLKSEQIQVEGPKLELKAASALSMSLILHELATNASKHGALSDTMGTVRIEWTVEQTPESTLRIEWSEHGGPSVEKPEGKGFGLSLIPRVVGHEFGGEAEPRFETSGLIVSMAMPLDALVAEPDAADMEPWRE